jgi:SHS family lactate transporter-like MFS transporter
MVPPILTYFATSPGWELGFAIPMMVGTLFGLANFILSVLVGPETKGTVMVAELSVA